MRWIKDDAEEPSIHTQPAAVAAAAPVNPAAPATLTNPAQIVEEQGQVSPLYVGRVIGKGGEMIRDLQARSGCRDQHSLLSV